VGIFIVSRTNKKTSWWQIATNWFSLIVKWLFCGVDHQCHVSGAFDVLCDGALVLGAVAAYAAGQDFAALGCEAAQFVRAFVINDGNLIYTELTDALFTASASFLHHIISLQSVD